MSFRLKYRLALRFVRSRRKGSLTRFISFASTCGIAIGVFAAVVGLSAMNGFEYELEHRVLSVLPMAELSSSEPYFKDDQAIIEVLKSNHNILGASPAIKQRAIITANRAFAPLIIAGISADSISDVVQLDRFSSINLACLKKMGIDPNDLNDGNKFNDKLHQNCDLSSIFKKQFSTNPLYSKAQSDLSDQVNQAQKEAIATSKFPTKDYVQNIGDNMAHNVNNKLHLDEANQISDQQIANIASTDVKNAEDLAFTKNLEDLPRIILGSGLAKRLKVKVGDIVDVITLNSYYQDQTKDKEAQQDNNLDMQVLDSLKKPERKKSLVIGLVDVGGQLDTTVAFMDIDILKSMTSLDGPNSIYIKTSDLHQTKEQVLEATKGKIKESAYLVTWMNSQGKLYNDIQMVRQIMFIAMFLVLAVACFNIVSNLMMMVGEKRREIAVLLTMGMQPQQVITTFSLMGIIFGARGTFIGLILGIFVSLLITPFTLSFKSLFGFDLLNKEVYFVNFIPCRLEIIDVLMVVGVSLLMSLFASLYPAFKASRVIPSRELNI